MCAAVRYLPLAISAASVGGYTIPALMCSGFTVPGIASALVNWGTTDITLIEDTSMLWDEYCLIRLSIQYRGRAIPLARASDSTWQ